MNLRITFVSLFFFSTCLLFGQPYFMDGNDQIITTCGSYLMDSGGAASNYGPNQKITLTICPDGSSGTHTQLIFSGTEISLGDDLCFYDGMNPLAPSLGCASDFNGGSAFIIQATAANPTGCLTLDFSSNATLEGAGWSAQINCIPACQLIESEIVVSIPASDPIEDGWIDICPGDEITFTGTGIYPQNGIVYNHSNLTSTFEWDFGDGTQASGTSVSHIFEEPGGYIVQLSITDQLGCKNTNFISQRVRVATSPSFVLGGDIPTEICSGDTVLLNAMVNNLNNDYEVSVSPTEGSFQAGATRSDSLALPDGDGASYQTSVSFTNFSPGQSLMDIDDLESICVVMEHSWMRDLEITLTCPNGQSAVLHNHPGQDGGEVFLGEPIDNDGFNPTPGTGWEYCWEPGDGITWIQYADIHNDPQYLPPGNYGTFESLDSLIGCPLNGEWTITVTDLWAIDNGFIFSWGVNFVDSLYPNLETFTPTLVDWSWDLAPGAYFQTADSVAATPQNAGNMFYNFSVTDDFGCAHDTMVNLSVLPLTHPNCYNCEELLTPVPDTSVCVGEPVELDVFSNYTEENIISFESFDNEDFNASTHPPANTFQASIQVNSIFPTSIQNPLDEIESVCLDIDTEAAGNLRIWLHAPNGNVLTLSTNNGGQLDNFTQTCFTPDAANSIVFGTAPFTGNWLPESSWTQLNGATINGEWRLEISDIANTNTLNTLNWWSITFKSQNEVNYTWTPSSNLSCDDCSDPIINTNQNTTVTVVATDVHNCTNSETVNIDVFQGFAAPQLSYTLIAGGEIEFTWTEVGDDLQYEVNINGTGWIPSNNGSTSHLVTGIMNGDQIDFQVRVAIANVFCDAEIDSESITFIMCDNFNAFIPNSWPTPYSVSCPGVCDGVIPVSAENGVAPFVYTATHESGMTWSQNFGNFNDLCAGHYDIVVEDAIGCMDTVTFEVIEPSPIVLIGSEENPATCFGDDDASVTVQASGGTVAGDYQYEWNDPISQVTATAIGLLAGTYEVTVTDDNGCSATTNATAAEPLELTVTMNKKDVLCFGDATGEGIVTVMGGNGGNIFDWGGVGSAPNEYWNMELPAGAYLVTVTDGNGCLIIGDIIITQPSTPVDLSVEQTVFGCFGEPNSVAMVTANGGIPSYSYNWSSGSFSNVAPDLSNQNYTVTVTDGNGCTVDGDIDIDQLDPYELNINFTEPSCNGVADGQMVVIVVSGGAAPDPDCTGCMFEWSNFGNTQFIDGLQGGLSYSVTITDQQGCTGTLARMLPQPDPITFDINTTDATCFGDDDGTANVGNVAGAQGNITFQWDANAQNQTTQIASNLMAGMYSVVVTDTSGCTSTEIAEIGQPDQILVTFETIDNGCNGAAEGALNANADGGSPGYTYNWSTGAITAKIDSLEAGDYLVTVTDIIGCTTVETAQVGEPAPIDADIASKDVTCFGDRDGTLTITPNGGTPPFTFSTDGQNFFGSNTLIGLETGNYMVHIKDGNNCVTALDASIGSPDEFLIDLAHNQGDGGEVIIDLGDSLSVWIVNEGENLFFGEEVFWNTSYCGAVFCKDGTSDCDTTLTCNPIVIKPENPLFIQVLAFDEKGCEAETMLNVRVNKERKVLVPTGFTPNNDGANDKLLVHGKSGTQVSMFRVFDRWGEMMWEAGGFMVNDPDIGWNGEFKGQEMPAGVYVWHMNVIFQDGREESMAGSFTLIR